MIDLGKYEDVVNVSELPPGATGYELLERKSVIDQLSSTGINLMDGDSFVRKLPEAGTYQFPPSVNALDLLKIKNQNQVGACAGFAVAQVGEGCSWIARGDTANRYSGWAQYILAQENDGFRRKGSNRFDRRDDKGSTPTGNAEAFMNTGLVPLGMCPPDPKTYDRGWAVTDEMREAAAEHKIKTAVYLKTPEHVKKFLQSGMGFVTLACRWMAHFDKNDGSFVLNDFHGPQRNDRHGGGHQVSLMGWYDHPEHGLCFILANSWSEAWQDQGGVLVTWKWLCDAMTDQMTILLGFSDLLLNSSQTQFNPRTPKVTGGSVFGSR